MPRRPEEEGPEPEGGRASERLRQHLDSRFGTDDWPDDAAIEDVRDPSSSERDTATPGEVDDAAPPMEPEDADDEPVDDEEDDPDDWPESPDLDEDEAPPERTTAELHDEDEGDHLTE